VSSGAAPSALNVVIAGGGVAALECALALRDLAGDRVATTLLAPGPDFVCRPLVLHEPFTHEAAARYPLDEIACEIGAELIADSFKWLDGSRRIVHTPTGRRIAYDELVLALGASRYEGHRHATTLDDERPTEQLGALIDEIRSGAVRSIAFVVPSRMPWPLPVYELALMTASTAEQADVGVSITILTPEAAPLALFGNAVSSAVAGLLAAREIATLTSVHCDVPEPGLVAVHPGHRPLRVDRVIALPELYGPSTPGVPGGAQAGFIPVDRYGKVRGIEHVHAAGDATDFPVKHGCIAAQHAATVAQAIAATTGCAEPPGPFTPTIRGILLGGPAPLYLAARVTGSQGSYSQISETPLWSPPSKIAARHLAPFLAARDRVGVAAA
jgi:sulfide:quinone oxidoreductase